MSNQPIPIKAVSFAKYSEEIVEKICAIIRAEGVSDSCAAFLAGATAQSLHQWKKREPELADHLQAARAQYRRARLEEIRDLRGRDGSPDWRAQAWLTENAGAEVDGLRAPEEPPVKELSPLLVIPPDQMEMLQERRRLLMAEMKPAQVVYE